LARLPVVVGESAVVIDFSILTQCPVLATYGDDVVAEVVQEVTGAQRPEPSGRS
jgi:hypothetical protein